MKLEAPHEYQFGQTPGGCVFRPAITMAVVVACFLVLPVAAQTPAPPQFISASEVALGFQPGQAVLAKNVAGTNHMDLVVSNNSNIEVVPGDGKGDFGTPIVTSVGCSGGFVIGDVNGDGYPDLILNNTCGQLQVWLNNGNGTFGTNNNGTYSPSESISVPFYTGTNTPVDLADVNGDGLLDVVVPVGCCGPSTGIFIYLNNGTGSFSTSYTNVPLPGTFDGAFAIGAFTNGGLPDFALGETSSTQPYVNSVVVLQNTTASGSTSISFSTGTPIQLTPSTNTTAQALSGLVAADFDNNVSVDLLAIEPQSGSSTGTLYYLEGDGGGGFATPQTLPNEPMPAFGRFASADFNGDGLPDLVFINGNDGFLLLLNQGVSGGTLSFKAAANYVAGPFSQTPVVGQLTSSGFNDVVVPNSSGAAVLINNGNGTFQAAQSFAAGNAPQNIIKLSNFFGNNETDLAVMDTTDGVVNVFSTPTPANGTLSGRSTQLAAPSGTTLTAIAGGCLKASSTSTCTAFIALASNNSTAGTSQVEVFTGAPLSSSATFSVGSGTVAAMGAGTFSNTGNTDLALAMSSGVLQFLYGNGAGNFTLDTQNTPIIGINAVPVALTVADFDNNGTPDIAVLNANSLAPELRVFLLSSTAVGSVGVLSQTSYPISSPAGVTVTPAPTSMTTGEFFATPTHAETVPDIVVLSGNEQELQVFQNNGAGVFSGLTPQQTVVINGVTESMLGLTGQMVAADFNGDGIIDLAVTNQQSLSGTCGVNDSVQVLLGNGNGTFQANTPCGFLNSDAVGWVFAAGNGVNSVVGSDFNGDGKLDLAFADQSGNMISVLLGGTPPVVSALPTVIGISPTAGPAPGGTSVTITGTNFTGATSVNFGTTAATNFTTTNATSITATSPAGPGGTTVDVTVTTPGGTSATSSANQFTYLAITPTSLPDAYLGVDYSQALSLSGGTGTVTWSETGALPNGVSLSTAGVFSGAPTLTSSLPAPFPITVTAAASNGSVQQNYTLTVQAPLTFSPSPLDFGTVNIGVTSTLGLTITNQSPSTVSFVPALPTNSPFGFATSGSTCTGSLAPGTNCIMDLTVTPTAVGTAPATSLSFLINNITGAAEGVTLTGSGGTTLISVPNVVGSTESAANTTITGTGLTVGTVTLESSTTVTAGDVISETPSAGTLVNPGSAVNLVISTGTPDNETITVNDTDVVVPFTLVAPISVSAPVAYFTAGSPLGFSSGDEQTVAISNIGQASMTLSSVTSSGPFTISLFDCFSGATASGTSAATIPTGGFCSVSVTYTGSAPSTDTGTLVFTDNAGSSNLPTSGTAPNYTQSITLNGSGGVTAAPAAPPATINVPNDDEIITVSDAVQVAPLTLVAPISVTAPVAYFTTDSPLGFGSQAGSEQTVAISNIGQASITVASVSASGPFIVALFNCFSGATVTGAASATIPTGGFCTVTINYTGSAPTTDTGTLIFTDNAGLSNLPTSGTTPNYTQSITLNGSGGVTAAPAAPPATVPVSDSETIQVQDTVSVQVPTASVSATQLSFASTLITTVTAAQTLTLTNTGSLSVSVNSVALSGTNAGDFKVTDHCGGTTLAQSGSCSIAVGFTPTAAGTRHATLVISDNAGGQTVSLSGTGTDFSLGGTSSGSTSSSVAPGQTATYSLQVAPIDGFTGVVSLICVSKPADSTCTVSPPSVTLTGAAGGFSVSVTTSAPSVLGLQGRPPMGRSSLPNAIWMFAAFTLMSASVALRGRRGVFVRAALSCALASLLASCLTTPPPPTPVGGTPKGTYTLTVAGESSGVSRTVNLSLTVK